MKNKLGILVVSVLCLSCSSDKNEERRKYLETNGIEIKKERVIAWFPKDSVSEKRMNEIVDTLNMGIALADKFIGGPKEWQMFSNKKLTYYYSPGPFFIANTSNSGDIFIPFIRLKNNTMPWLHETMHVLLRSKKGNWHNKSNVISYFYMPQWFNEGMAEYLAVKISYDNKIPKVDLFKSGGYLSVDSVCWKNLQQENGPDVLSKIGKAGAPTELAGEKRREFAPPFYNCSCSFTKYLVETYGLEKMLTANSEFEHEHETIEKLTQKSIEELKKEWIDQLRKDAK
ncbi:MAG: hypothetical protein HY015_06070 [Bacteroidetes bacterium]|nr:hypothetical protein [Bacteroidota bacterium]MBI3482529.1 hypothetical protein [Bacteroidota bacterium]